MLAQNNVVPLHADQPTRSGDTAAAHQKSMELRAHNLSKTYRSRVVVKDVSLNVHSGEVIGLLGPNGAGKTTCFYMMVGLVAMDGGELYLDGERVTHLPIHARARRGLSYLPQEASIFRRLTVAENVRAVLELHNDDTSTIDLKLDDLLRELHVAHRASFCSTSRSPVSIRSPSWTSRKSSHS